LTAKKKVWRQLLWQSCCQLSEKLPYQRGMIDDLAEKLDSSKTSTASKTGSLQTKLKYHLYAII